MKKIYILLLFMLGELSVAYAQHESPQLPDYLPPSPLSQKMMRYGEHQPSLSTGAVNVTIPLYNIQVNDFSLPLSLNYYTNGIKLEDIPHPIGYGWSLQPAFRITRTVMGRPDGDKYPLFNEKIEGNDHRDFIYGKSALTLSYDGPSRYGYANEIDTRYDLFSVNLPHETFRFIIDKAENGNWIVTTDGSACKVQFTLDEIIVTDDNGIIYVFNIKEYAYDGIANTQTVTTWGLKEIRLPGNKGTLVFNWGMANLGQFTTFSPQSLTTFKDYCQSFEGQPLDDPHGALQIHNSGCNISINPYSYKENIQLESITTPHGTVSFNYHTDLSCKFLLENIQITNSISTVVKEINFEYNLYNLKALSILGVGEEKYSFSYNNPVIFDNNMVPDYWGYNTGRAGGNATKVRIPIKEYGQLTTREYDLGCDDRTPSIDGMKRNILELITYPTGGSTRFHYEMHSFDGREVKTLSSVFKFTQGGGLRVSAIINKASPTSSNEIKYYKYGKNENGKGNSSFEPTPDTFINEQVVFSNFNSTARQHGYSYRQLSIKSQSDIEEFLTYYPAVWYDEVTEYVNNNDKTVYMYEFPELVNGGRTLQSIHPDIHCSGYTNDIIYFPNFGKLYPTFVTPGISPNLKYKIVYKKDSGIYKEVLEQEFHYNYLKNISVNNTSVFQTAIKGWGTDGEGHFSTGGSIYPERIIIGQVVGSPNIYGTDLYGFGNYRLELGRNFQIGETTIYHDGEQTNTQYITYLYSRYNNKLLSKKTTNSSGGILEEKFYYPHNFDSCGIALSEYYPDKVNANPGASSSAERLISVHKLSTPILMEWYQNANFTGKKHIIYIDNRDNLVLPHIEYYASNDESGEPRIRYRDYDFYGNPVYITMDDDIDLIYLWSYKGQYPVAEIKNATYKEVEDAIKSVFPVTSINDLSRTLIPVESKLKDGSLHAALPNAQVNTYTYLPSIGMLSATNPQGFTIYYDYDDSGRLQQSWFYDGDDIEILEKYEYNYLNQ